MFAFAYAAMHVPILNSFLEESALAFSENFTKPYHYFCPLLIVLMANKTSQHILGTSANLLGFCLFVIASFHVTNYSSQTMIDEFAAAVGFILAVSCIFSFLSLRTDKPELTKRLETIADYLFFAALIGIAVIILLIAFRILK